MQTCCGEYRKECIFQVCHPAQTPREKITGAQNQICMAIAHPTLPLISLEGP